MLLYLLLNLTCDLSVIYFVVVVAMVDDSEKQFRFHHRHQTGEMMMNCEFESVVLLVFVVAVAVAFVAVAVAFVAVAVETVVEQNY